MSRIICMPNGKDLDPSDRARGKLIEAMDQYGPHKSRFNLSLVGTYLLQFADCVTVLICMF